jgi:hypothetical protein
MTMRQLIVILAALALGCGTAQSAIGPEQEVLTADGAPPRTPTEKDSWCQPPPGFPLKIMLITDKLCWIELDATQAECAQLKRDERWPHMLHGGRCWFLQARKPERQPTSSLLP